ncbi:hypothetical protein GCM10009039_29640 [Halocalculus aciditolerans]|uniref:Uncharacterized protein n=1 Tax=Halocalculus aciditolerans TaxID=1383812 RepID=A0A830FFL2_9EURY|nr:hypothetical protein GCM10009039_29640 [Halocalculus aciditolerans]
MVEVAVGDDDGVRLGRLDGELRGGPGEHPEVEEEGVVHEDGAPTDLADAAEEPNVHSWAYAAEWFGPVGARRRRVRSLLELPGILLAGRMIIDVGAETY